MRFPVDLSSLSFAFLLTLSACNDGGDTSPLDGGAVDATVLRDMTFQDVGSFVPGDAIDVPDNTWTWVDFPNTHCMDGSATGIGVFRNPASDRVIIYLDGGGACFNEATCGSVANPLGYNGSDFYPPASGIFDRADAENPFRDFSMVFVPYCSGDIYAGANSAGLGGRMFMGYINMGEFLNRLVPTFSDSELVVLSGSSAGGFGASYNYDRTQIAFGDTPVVLLNDSAPFFTTMYLKPCLQGLLRSTWNLEATLPHDCTNCYNEADGLSHFLPFLATKYSNTRMALVSSARDSVIRYFYGFGLSDDCSVSESFSATEYTVALHELRDETLAGAANFSTYFVDSSDHVWLYSSLSETSEGTPAIALSDWLSDWLDPAAVVSNVGN